MIISYLVKCKELNFNRWYDDYETAHTVVLQLAKDYPLLTFEMYKNTLFVDDDELGEQGVKA
ncbi:hypothetical protein [Moraxella nasicaprae]|uniref:Uncharacterized protein n=1 Tax=Moraxella nasicaprae TaxID=2904122 RepID=A0ABY6F624_9GAMM|nr:hypothetical protein [Moraxella nasicaprae]UXZ05546.1 hypothetical protein LU297_03620 [Moraxella nasicaprae]